MSEISCRAADSREPLRCGDTSSQRHLPTPGSHVWPLNNFVVGWPDVEQRRRRAALDALYSRHPVGGSFEFDFKWILKHSATVRLGYFQKLEWTRTQLPTWGLLSRQPPTLPNHRSLPRPRTKSTKGSRNPMEDSSAGPVCNLLSFPRFSCWILLVLIFSTGSAAPILLNGESSLLLERQLHPPSAHFESSELSLPLELSDRLLVCARGVPAESFAFGSVADSDPPASDVDSSPSIAPEGILHRGPGRPRKRSLAQSELLSPSGHKRGPGRPPSSGRKPPVQMPLPSTMTTRSRESQDIFLLLSPGQQQHVSVKLPPRADVDITIPDVRFVDERVEATALDQLRQSGQLRSRPPKRRCLATCTPQRELLVQSAPVGLVPAPLDDGEDGILLIGEVTSQPSRARAIPSPSASPARTPSRVLESFRASINEQILNRSSSGARPADADGIVGGLNDESEDTDDECFALRHFQSEMEERVRWEKSSKAPKFSSADLAMSEDQFVDSAFWESYFSYPFPRRPSDEEWARWDSEQAERARQGPSFSKPARAKDRKSHSPFNDAAHFGLTDESHADYLSKKRKRGAKPTLLGWGSVSASDELSEDVNIDSIDGDFFFPETPSSVSHPLPSQKITLKIGPRLSTGAATPAGRNSAASSTRTRRGSHPNSAGGASEETALAVRSRKGGVMTRGRSRTPLTETEKRELELDARVRRVIDSTFVWMVSPSEATQKPTFIRLKRHNVASVHSHEFLSSPPPEMSAASFVPHPDPPAAEPQHETARNSL